jgi:hypothetical protein
MPFIETQPTVLTAHASTPNDAVRSLGVQLQAEEPGILVFRYSLDADMCRVRIPPSGTGGRADALWRHTCFEAFVAPADGPGYHEFNFSPSLDWAIYRFSAYREGCRRPRSGGSEISVRRRDDGLELQRRVLGILLTCVTPVSCGSPWPRLSKTEMVNFRTGVCGTARQTRFPSPQRICSGSCPLMRFGIDRLLEEPELRKPLAGRRVALLAHPASVTRNMVHSLDALATVGDVRLSAAFGPQHGLRGDKQDNMVESQDYPILCTASRSSAFTGSAAADTANDGFL